ncbi:hypothetical protein RclHR1_24230003 [Rhizophagus clarus]|uniref:Uncharacterized protein n=1 Tax=Rhizophagus clarus TaxID=94130 RepID=A0A2Z6QZ02_9GLOM|nr:hypothetical protein RclHR1_24230003 [Rhizophagus clarus]
MICNFNFFSQPSVTPAVTPATFPAATPPPNTVSTNGSNKKYSTFTTYVSSTSEVPAHKTSVPTVIDGKPTTVEVVVPASKTVVVKAVVTSVPAEALTDDGSAGNINRGFIGIGLSLIIGIISSLFMLIV